MNENEKKQRRRESVKRYNDEKMAYQTFKVRKELLEEFRLICAERGDKVNTVLREAVEDYVARNRKRPKSGLTALTQSLDTYRETARPVLDDLAADYEPKIWETALPQKYWGRFREENDFYEYMRENNLEDEVAEHIVNRATGRYK